MRLPAQYMLYLHCPEKSPLWDSHPYGQSIFSRETWQRRAWPERRKRDSPAAPDSECFAPPARIYLTPKEVGLLMDGARGRGRYGHRDSTMILVAYRHGLRPAELTGLRWDQLYLGHGCSTYGA